ncbi:hypothetical protein QAD02_021760 [Eretmocerus hayati]|uniref:Uncharacterized protein n=1 Tax=Eretmocerus hayati TaxID=131215 RepID=A0ACC2PRD6_9HYME|nr:hypothetical protein QAD02_021760 [Eretmocerus hayati]
MESIGILEDQAEEKGDLAIWNKGELEKRSPSQEEIKRWKQIAKESGTKIVFHFDFAENWTILQKNEIQSAYWKKEQLSVFTAVCYFKGTTQSFVIISDDTTHDSAHASSATQHMESY